MFGLAFAFGDFSDTLDVVDGPADAIMSGIKVSLLLLTEASSLASKFPFISPIAHMLLHAFQMHGVRVLSLFQGLSR